MPRSWTQQSKDTFEIHRRRYLTEIDDPASEPWDVLSEEQRDNYLKSLPKKISGGEFKRLTSQAWNIGKRPVGRYFAPRKGVLQLPKGMNAKTGYDAVRFRKGDELNGLVFEHYDGRVDPSTYPGVNYVSSDGMLPKRREYLGPSPHIAGFRFTGDSCDVEFWEQYLEKAWVRDTTWTVEAEFDDEVQWWFPKDRST